MHVLFLDALGRVATRVSTFKLKNELPRVYYWNTYGTGSPEEFNVHTPNELPRVKTHRVMIVTYLWLLKLPRTVQGEFKLFTCVETFLALEYMKPMSPRV